MVTVTSPVGSVASAAVYSLLRPATTLSLVGSIVTPASSSSVMLTVACVVVPSETAGGSVPKPSNTLSPSSSTPSWMASKVMVCDICPVLKVRLSGMPE